VSDLPVVITKAGLQPTAPADLRAQLTDAATALSPGLTTNLPGSLIEDMASTGTGGLVVCDQARVDLVNSLTPYAANELLLNQLGVVYGVVRGEASNTSVYVVFTGTVGFAISQGFVVSDGTNQFVLQEGGIIGSSGSSPKLFAVATQGGSFSVPADTVTTIVTSLPPLVTLTVTNPSSGTPGADAESDAEYRVRLMQAGLASAQGMTNFLKTQLANVHGVQQRLISVRAVSGGWEVIVGGGDPYRVAYAIFSAVFDLPSLMGSTISITGITNANPGVVTTDLNHGLTTGQNNVNIAGVVGMTGVNGGPYTVTVLTEKTFSFGVNTTSSGTYTSGGVVTPNSRNVVVSINDYPDTYDVPFVVPPEQTVAVTVTWNTIATNFIADDSVAQAASQAIANYINSIPVGLPISQYEIQTTFMESVADIIPEQLISKIVIAVDINSVPTSVTSGTGFYEGDPESYFSTSPESISIVRG
jgi:hypothetical protein